MDFISDINRILRARKIKISHLKSLDLELFFKISFFKWIELNDKIAFLWLKNGFMVSRKFEILKIFTGGDLVLVHTWS